MKIVVYRKTFLSIGHEVLFTKYTPCYFEDLSDFSKSLGSNDFDCQTLANALVFEDSGGFIDTCLAMESGKSAPIDIDCTTRDGDE